MDSSSPIPSSFLFSSLSDSLSLSVSDGDVVVSEELVGLVDRAFGLLEDGVTPGEEEEELGLVIDGVVAAGKGETLGSAGGGNASDSVKKRPKFCRYLSMLSGALNRSASLIVFH